jgi:hypothetical protein
VLSIEATGDEAGEAHALLLVLPPPPPPPLLLLLFAFSSLPRRSI